MFNRLKTKKQLDTQVKITDSIKGVITISVCEQESAAPGGGVVFAVSCATACSLRVSPLRVRLLDALFIQALRN